MTTQRRRTSRGSRARRSSTPTAWWNEQSANNSLAAGSSARFALLDPLASTGLPATWEAGLTVIRLILEVVVRGVTNNASGFGAFGVMVNSTRTLVDVILDLFDYYLHQNFSTNQFATLNAVEPARYRYDLRTARKLRGGERALDFVITNNSASGTGIVWTVSARMLLKA